MMLGDEVDTVRTQSTPLLPVHPSIVLPSILPLNISYHFGPLWFLPARVFWI